MRQGLRRARRVPWGTTAKLAVIGWGRGIQRYRLPKSRGSSTADGNTSYSLSFYLSLSISFLSPSLSLDVCPSLFLSLCTRERALARTQCSRGQERRGRVAWCLLGGLHVRAYVSERDGNVMRWKHYDTRNRTERDVIGTSERKGEGG